MRTTFLVGRVTRTSAEMVVVEGVGSPPIPGPWTLKALVRPSPHSASVPPGTQPQDPLGIHRRRGRLGPIPPSWRRP